MSTDRIQTLLDAVVGMTMDQAEREGGFNPLGLGISADGEQLVLLAPEFEDGHEIEMSEYVEALRLLVLQAGTDGSCIATAFAADTTMTHRETGEEQDAIHVLIEDAELDPLVCVVPYTLEGGSATTEDAMAMPGERTWSAPAGGSGGG